MLIRVDGRLVKKRNDLLTLTLADGLFQDHSKIIYVEFYIAELIAFFPESTCQQKQDTPKACALTISFLKDVRKFSKNNQQNIIFRESLKVFLAMTHSLWVNSKIKVRTYFPIAVTLWKLTRYFLQYSVYGYYQNLERAHERHQKDEFYEMELCKMFSCNREWKPKTFYGQLLQVGRNYMQNFHKQ